VREHEIFSETKNEQGQRDGGHGGKGDAASTKQAKTVPEIINGLEEELADVAFTDVRGDLPVVFVDGGQNVYDGDHNVIKNHFGLSKAGERATRGLARVNGVPEGKHREQRDETEHGPRQIIEAVGQIILNPDVDDVPIFFHALFKCAGRALLVILRRGENKLGARKKGSGRNHRLCLRRPLPTRGGISSVKRCNFFNKKYWKSH
jgi:hypothetical protein